MKRRRGILLGIAFLVTATVVLVALAFSSAIQTRVARNLLRDQPGLEASLDRLQVGWSSVRVEGLAVQQGALTLRAPRIEASLPVWRLLTDRIELNQLVAYDWEVQFDPAGAPAAPTVTAATPSSPRSAAGWGEALTSLGGLLAAADGDAAAGLGSLLEALQLPVDVSIGQVDLQGTAAWRHAGPGADGHASVTIFGGDLGAGRTGNFKVVIKAEGERASAAGIQSLLIDTNLGLTLADARTLDHVNLSADLAGRRADLEQPNRFNLQFDLQVTDGSPRAEFSLSDQHTRLVNLELVRADSGDNLAGSWSIALNDVSLGSLMLGRRMPGFNVQGQGSLRAASDLTTGAVDGRVTFAVSDLTVLMAELNRIGTLSGQLDFGAELRESGMRVTQLDLGVDGAAPVLTARLLQGVEIAGETNEIRVPRPEEPVFAVDLTGVPLAWAQPWLDPYVLDARPVRGGFVGMVSQHGLRIVTTDELHVPGLVAAEEGRTLLDEVDVSLRVGAEITAEGWQVELDRLDLADATGPLASFSARGGRLTRENDVIKLAGRFEADLRAIDRVPLLAQNLALKTGRLEGEFGLGVEDRISLAATLAATGLTLAGGEVMPEMQFDGRIDLFPNGSMEAHLPMRFTREERVSDLTLNVSATPVDGGWQAEGSLSGPRAFVADLQGLGLIVAAAPEAPNAPAPAAGEVATAALQPIWAGWTGTFKTAIGELTLPNGLVLENIRGDIQLDANQLNLSGVNATLSGGGDVQLDGGLGFDATRPQNYEAKGQLRAEGVDVGAILRVLDPAQVPPLEGRLNLAADLDSAVSDLSELAANAAVNARVTSAGGILRALQVDVQQYLEAGRTLAAVGGLVAALSGNQDIGRRAQRLQALTQVADQLSALTFDQLNLELNRAPRGDLILRDLAVISPGVRLLGNGSIAYREDTSLWLAPLALTLQLAAREEIGDLLARLNLVQPDADALGYRPLVQSVHLDGSLHDVGTAELGRLLSRALR